MGKRIRHSKKEKKVKEEIKIEKPEKKQHFVLDVQDSTMSSNTKFIGGK